MGSLGLGSIGPKLGSVGSMGPKHERRSRDQLA